MSQRLRLLVDRLVQEIFVERDVGKLRDYVSPDYVEHMSFAGSERSMEGMIACLAAFFREVPDFRCTIEDMVVEGDQLVARGTMSGTFGGPGGRPFSIAGVDWVRFEGDKMAEHWGYYEESSLAAQLGERSLNELLR